MAKEEYLDRYPELAETYGIHSGIDKLVPSDDFFAHLDEHAIGYTPLENGGVEIIFDNGRGMLYNQGYMTPFVIDGEDKQILSSGSFYAADASFPRFNSDLKQMGAFIQGEDVNFGNGAEIMRDKGISYEDFSQNMGFFITGQSMSGAEVFDVYNKFKGAENVQFSGDMSPFGEEWGISISWTDNGVMHEVLAEENHDRARVEYNVTDANGEVSTNVVHNWDSYDLLHKIEGVGVSFETLDTNVNKTLGSEWVANFVEDVSNFRAFNAASEYPGVVLDEQGHVKEGDAYFQASENEVILTRCRVSESYDMDNNAVSNIETFSVSIQFDRESQEFVLSDIYTSDGGPHGYISDTSELARFGAHEISEMEEFLDKEISKSFNSISELNDKDVGMSIDE